MLQWDLMSSSSYELLTLRALQALFPQIVWQRQLRPNWLSYPPTGRNLELDLFNPDYKLAIEVQGPQHYRSVSGLASADRSYDQVQRDTWKLNTCLARGITLITVDMQTFQTSARFYTLYLHIWPALRTTERMKTRSEVERKPEVQAIIQEANRLTKRRVKPWVDRPKKRSWFRRIFHYA